MRLPQLLLLAHSLCWVWCICFGKQVSADQGVAPELNEKDVVVLKTANFDDAIKQTQFVMVRYPTA